jgi:hypothetical protein
MSPEERIEYYKMHITAQKKSGLSVREYSAQNNMGYTQFYVWRKKLFGDLPQKKVTNFKKVTIVNKKREPNVMLTYPDGLKISIENLEGSDILSFVQSLRG